MRQVRFSFGGKNHKLHVHDDEELSNHIVRQGSFYEDEVLDKVGTYGKFKKVIDVGANIGNHTAYFLNVWGVEQVIAVEPIQENFDLLLLNINSDPRALPLLGCLGECVGRASMVVDTTNMGRCYRQQIGRDVPMLTLDTIAPPDTDFIKIDVEGSELSVLQGAVKTLENARPVLLIEGDPLELQEALKPFQIGRAHV